MSRTSSSSSCVGLAVNLLLSFVAAVGRGGRTLSGGRPVNGSIIAPRIAWNNRSWLLLGLLLLEKVKQGEAREQRRQVTYPQTKYEGRPLRQRSTG